MAELTTILRDDIIPIRSNIHDCADNSSTQTLVNGVRTLYTNNKLVYEDKSGTTDLWDAVTSTVNDTIEYSKIDIIVGGKMNAASANTRLFIELVIPATTEILVRSFDIEINRIGVDIENSGNFLVYNGPAALQDGFQIYLTAIGGNIDISNTHILIRI